jgi:hypothetical protein
MKKHFFIKLFVCLVIFTGFSGCAYRYYLGMHGPSIKAFPDEHEGVTEDHECLECHDPDIDFEGPPTSHPNFSGCLKCHSDDVKTQ